MKKFVALVLILITAVTLATGCRKGNVDGIEIDPNRTQLYVYNYNGGVGSAWLDKVIARFESKYSGESFEDGKTGVQVIPKKTKSGFESLLQTSNNAVFFAQQVYYNELASQNKILPITDVVRDDTGGPSIESMLTDSQRAAFTALDGNYYVLPHYVLYSGLTYDKDVFEEYKLYFNKAGNGFTNFQLAYNEDYEKSNLSAGPDGVGGTYDDGLPSSLEEFYRLCEQMVKVGVIPLIYCGQYPAYSTHLLNALWVAYTGAEEFYYNFSLDSKGKAASYISGFDGETPVLASEVITPENGYLLKAQPGKLYALNFLRKALDEGWFDQSSYNSSTSHTDTHRNYIYSLPESESDPTKKPIAMLIEGTHWYNEAGEVLSDAAAKFPLRSERNFAIMPLPTRYDDERDCKRNTVCDSNSSFAFINANIKEDVTALKLAKLFLKFCYTESEEVVFRVLTPSALNQVIIRFTDVYDRSKGVAVSMVNAACTDVGWGETAATYIKTGGAADEFKGAFYEEPMSPVENPLGRLGSGEAVIMLRFDPSSNAFYLKLNDPTLYPLNGNIPEIPFSAENVNREVEVSVEFVGNTAQASIFVTEIGGSLS